MTVKDSISAKIAAHKAEIAKLQNLLNNGGAWLESEPADIHAFIDDIVNKTIPALGSEDLPTGIILPPD